MSRTVFLAAVLVSALPLGAQPVDDPSGVSRRSAASAIALLDRAVAAHAPGPSCVIELRYDGTWKVEGHFLRPHEVRPFRTRERYVVSGGAVRYESVTGESDEDLAASPETFLLSGARVLRRPDGAHPFQELGSDGETARFWATAALPGEAVRRARDRAVSARLAGPAAVSFVDVDGVSSTLTFEESTGLLRSIERLRADPRLGDVCDWVRYEEYTATGGIAVPRRVLARRHPLDEAGWLAMTLTGSRPLDSARDLEPPAEALSAPPATTAPPATPRIARLAEGVWEVVLDDVDSRVLAVETADGLAVLEAPFSSEAGERIVDALARRFPGRPVRTVLVGHYHPHYTGGLRAFVAAGATVVTTPGNAEYVREIAARPFTLAPDRLARAPKPLRLELVTGRRSLAGGAVEAIDLGDASRHTDEYLVFHLPAAKLLFQGDLGWFRADDGELRAGRRAEGLLNALDAWRLPVERLVQSWPAKGNAATVTVAELRELVRRRNESQRK